MLKCETREIKKAGKDRTAFWPIWLGNKELNQADKQDICNHDRKGGPNYRLGRGVAHPFGAALGAEPRPTAAKANKIAVNHRLQRRGNRVLQFEIEQAKPSILGPGHCSANRLGEITGDDRDVIDKD